MKDKYDEVACPKCGGNGYTAEHSSALDAHDGEGNCTGDCPVQVQCETCEGSGRIPEAKRAPVPSAEELESLLCRIDADFGGEALTIIKAAFAAQRQAGREEAAREAARDRDTLTKAAERVCNGCKRRCARHEGIEWKCEKIKAILAPLAEGGKHGNK